MRGIHDLSCERTRKIKVCGADLNDYVDRPQMEMAVETLVKKALNQMREGSTLSIATLKENNTFKLVMRYPSSTSHEMT